MRIRVTGFVLAVLIAVSLTLSAFASTETENTPVETPQVSAIPQNAVVPAAVMAESPFTLDGMTMYGLDYEVYKDTNYITVESFVAAVDRNAVVEEENGTVIVTSDAAASVVTVIGYGWVISGTANAEKETLSLTAKKGNYYAEANGRVLYVENGVITVNGKVALPVRVLAKIFNMDVAYDSVSMKVALTRREEGGSYLEDADTYYNQDTLYWLSHIIHAESGNQPLRGKIAVGNVVMNRLASPNFPNTIYDVLFQKNQFSPAMSGSIYRDPNAASVRAAKMVMDGAEALEDVLFFNRKGMNTRAARNRTFVATIGGHSFYA